MSHDFVVSQHSVHSVQSPAHSAFLELLLHEQAAAANIAATTAIDITTFFIILIINRVKQNTFWTKIETFHLNPKKKLAIQFKNLHIIDSAGVQTETESRPDKMESLDPSSARIDYQHVALRIADDLKDMRMTTYEEIGPVLVYEPACIYIISSGISSYMDHQDFQAFALEDSMERMSVSEVVVVAVAGDAGEGLEGGYFSRQIKSPAEIAGMPDLVDRLQKGAEPVAEHSVCVRYQPYVFH